MNRSTRKPNTSDARAFLPSVALVLLLAIPCIGFPYLFDDYDFLARSQEFDPSRLLPSKEILYYRPISREIYFGVLTRLHASPLVAHLINLLAASAAALLLGLLVRRLAGIKAGVAAGLAFACCAQLPFLIGWASGAQDLLAIVFILVAFHLKLSDRLGLSVIAATAALLSKETTVVLLPALALLGWFSGSPRKRFGWDVIYYGALLSIWGAFHPGVRVLIERLRSSEEGAYFKLMNTDALHNATLTLPSLLNLPATWHQAAWPGHLTPFLLFGAILVVGAMLWIQKRDGVLTAPALDQARRFRLLQLGLLLALPPALLSCTVIRVWAPYHVVIPWIGMSLILGVLLASLPWELTAAGLLLCLTTGIWSRGTVLEAGVASERNSQAIAPAIQKVERGFKALRPDLPDTCDVALSVQAQGSQSVYVHMYRLQALRVWYWKGGVRTRHVEDLPAIAGEPLLFWITPQLQVFELDLSTLQPRTSGPPADYSQYLRVLRLHARGLAAAGQSDRAVRILLRVPVTDTYTRVLHARLAAMVLLGAGQAQEANNLLSRLPNFDHRLSMQYVHDFLDDPPRGRIWDPYVLPAFGLSWSDETTVRQLMRSYVQGQSRYAASRFAVRLLEIHPQDSEAEAVLRTIASIPRPDRATIPVARDSL